MLLHININSVIGPFDKTYFVDSAVLTNDGTNGLFCDDRGAMTHILVRVSTSRMIHRRILVTTDR